MVPISKIWFLVIFVEKIINNLKKNASNSLFRVVPYEQLKKEDIQLAPFSTKLKAKNAAQTRI